jgi:hypothetical protein
VSIIFANAMIPCARSIRPNPLPIFFHISATSLYISAIFPFCICRKNLTIFLRSRMNIYDRIIPIKNLVARAHILRRFCSIFDHIVPISTLDNTSTTFCWSHIFIPRDVSIERKNCSIDVLYVGAFSTRDHISVDTCGTIPDMISVIIAMNTI